MQIDYNVSFANESNNNSDHEDHTTTFIISNDNNDPDSHSSSRSSSSNSNSDSIRNNTSIHSFNPLGHENAESEMRVFTEYQNDVAVSAAGEEEEW